jgi:hypothetical protein
MKTMILFLSLFFLTPITQAQQPSAAQIKRFQAKLTTELPKRFANADTNQDGQLTKAEAKGKMPRVYDNFEAIDRQGRGFVSLQDIQLYIHEQATTAGISLR